MAGCQKSEKVHTVTISHISRENSKPGFCISSDPLANQALGSHIQTCDLSARTLRSYPADVQVQAKSSGLCLSSDAYVQCIECILSLFPIGMPYGDTQFRTCETCNINKQYLSLRS